MWWTKVPPCHQQKHKPNMQEGKNKYRIGMELNACNIKNKYNIWEEMKGRVRYTYAKENIESPSTRRKRYKAVAAG